MFYWPGPLQSCLELNEPSQIVESEHIYAQLKSVLSFRVGGERLDMMWVGR